MLPHNYLIKFAELQARGLLIPGLLARVDVAHDTWCGMHLGQRCNCTPRITVIQRTKESP